MLCLDLSNARVSQQGLNGTLPAYCSLRSVLTSSEEGDELITNLGLIDV